MKKPIKPKKPPEPSKYRKHVLNTLIHRYETVGELISDFEENIKLINPNKSIDISKIIITDNSDWDSDYSSFKYILEEDKSKEEYDIEYEIYKTKLKTYHDKFKIFKQEMDKYIKFVEDEDIKKKKKLLKELKEEFENVEDS